MTDAPTPHSPADPQALARRINPRLLAILVGLFLLICITVIVTDQFAMRKQKVILTPAFNPGDAQ